MKLMVESLVVFVLSLAAAALIAQGEPAFAELAVVNAAAEPTSLVLLLEVVEPENGTQEKGGSPWLRP